MSSLLEKPFLDWTRENINDLMDIIEISVDKHAKLRLLNVLYQYIEYIENTPTTSYFPYEISMLKGYYMKQQQNILYRTSIHYPVNKNPSIMNYIQESIDDFQYNTPFNYIFMGIFILLCIFLRTIIYSYLFSSKMNSISNCGLSSHYNVSPPADSLSPPPQSLPPQSSPLSNLFQNLEPKKGIEIRLPIPQFLFNNSIVQKIMEHIVI